MDVGSGEWRGKRINGDEEEGMHVRYVGRGDEMVEGETDIMNKIERE